MDRLALREMPQVGIEGAPLFLDHKKYFRISYGRADFKPISDNTRVSHEPFHIGLPVPADFFRVKAIKALSEMLPPIQDCLPGQSGLKGLQEQHFKKLPILMHRPPPFLVMIGHIQGILRIRPMAACFMIYPFHTILLTKQYPSS